MNLYPYNNKKTSIKYTPIAFAWRPKLDQMNVVTPSTRNIYSSYLLTEKRLKMRFDCCFVLQSKFCPVSWHIRVSKIWFVDEQQTQVVNNENRGCWKSIIQKHSLLLSCLLHFCSHMKQIALSYSWHYLFWVEKVECHFLSAAYTTSIGFVFNYLWKLQMERESSQLNKSYNYKSGDVRWENFLN